MSGRGLDPETVEQDPSQVKASKRLKQVEEKRRIEAQCDGHLLENEKVNPRKVTQRPKEMSKDDAKRVAIEASRDAAWKSATERKGRFFFRAKNQWAKCVAWEPEQGSDPETGGLGCQFSFFRSGRINCLLGEQQWPSTTCFLARCSQRRSGHERRFARRWVCCVFHWFLQAWCQQENEIIFFPRAVRQEKPGVPILTESLQQRNEFMGKFWFIISTHGVMSRKREENFSKKNLAVKTDKEFLDKLKWWEQCGRSA